MQIEISLACASVIGSRRGPRSVRRPMRSHTARPPVSCVQLVGQEASGEGGEVGRPLSLSRWRIWRRSSGLVREGHRGGAAACVRYHAGNGAAVV